MANQGIRLLNRDAIKYIAVFTMLLNHISAIFLQPGSLLGESFRVIGYFTAVTMVYFLVEGYRYTHSHKAYFFRLVLFAAISELPFQLAFVGSELYTYRFNMICNLCLCWCVIHISRTEALLSLRLVLYAGLLFLSFFCDWGPLAPLYTLLFLWADGSREKTAAAYIFAMILLAVSDFFPYAETMPVEEAILSSCIDMAGVALSAVCILFFYNGKRVKKGRTFSKWFFYIFYPVHLSLLGMIRILIS